MNNGLFYKRIIFQQATNTTNEFGENIQSWTDKYTVWGQIIFMAGVERFEAAQLTAKADVKFVIRYKSGFDAKWRIKDKETSVVYDIYSIVNLGRKSYMEILGKRI